MRVVAVIQARMASSRLPGKVLRRVGQQAVLTHVLARAKAIPGVDEVHVTTTPRLEDDAITARCRGAGVGWSRGQVPGKNGKNDVLAGYVEAARVTKADIVLRITSDCPLLDPAIAESVRRAVHGYHYASNVNPPTLYDGCDVEAFTQVALTIANAYAGDHEREHVTTFLRTDPDITRVNVTVPGDWSRIKLSVDTAADLERIRKVWAQLPKPEFTWRDVVRGYRIAYPPSLLRRARRIFGAGSARIPEYLAGALQAADGARCPFEPRAAVLGYEDVTELGQTLSPDDVQAIRDLIDV